MKLIRMKLFKVEYNTGSYQYTEIIEANNYAEAEKLFIEKCDNRYPILSITEYKVPVFRKSIKTVTVEL